MPVTPIDWRARLDGIAESCSRYGWDSYGAPPVTPQAIQAANVLASSLDMVPTVFGGISILLASEGVTIELDEHGLVVAVCADARDVETYVATRLRTEASS